MLDSQTPLIASRHGAAYLTTCGSRLLMRFDGAWMALTREQLHGLGESLGRILNCPFKAHHLSAGLLLRSSQGEYRLSLTQETAEEFHGLINDLLLLLEAQRVAGSEGTPKYS